MTEAAKRFAELREALVKGRAEDIFVGDEDPAEDAILDEMDIHWRKMTGAERENEDQIALRTHSKRLHSDRPS